MVSRIDMLLNELQKENEFKITISLGSAIDLVIEKTNSIPKSIICLKDSRVSQIPFYENSRNLEQIAEKIEDMTALVSPDAPTNDMSPGQFKLVKEYGTRLSFIESLFHQLDETAQSYLKKIDEEINNVLNEKFVSLDRKEVKLYTTLFPGMRKIGAVVRKIYDFISLNYFSKSGIKCLDSYAERYIAWSVLEKGANEFADSLSHDAIYLSDAKHLLADDMSKVVAFYTEISFKAADVIRKLRQLYNDASSSLKVYSIEHNIDVEDLKNQVVAKWRALHE